MSLTYRLHRQEDLPELQRLWEDNTTWGTLTGDIWRRYMIDAPLGGSAIVVASDEDSGRIVGQFGFVPSLVAVGTRTVRAFRPAAPIVSKEYRFRSPNPLKHPAAAMYLYAVKALRERGDGLIYMVPDPRWVRFFRIFPGLVSGSFPLWKMELPLRNRFSLGEGFSATPLVEYGERVDRLWEAASPLHDCSVVRNAESLAWKIGSGEYEVLGIERRGELVGLVASRHKGDRQWLICDLLFADADETLRATLAAACNLAHERAVAASPDAPLVKAAVLVTPVMERMASELGFVRDEYDFPMVVHILDRSLSRDELAPERWYVSAND